MASDALGMLNTGWLLGEGQLSAERDGAIESISSNRLILRNRHLHRQMAAPAQDVSDSSDQFLDTKG